MLKALALALAGATVFLGPVGFGASHHIHTATIRQLSTEFVDPPEIVNGQSPRPNE